MIRFVETPPCHKVFLKLYNFHQGKAISNSANGIGLVGLSSDENLENTFVPHSLMRISRRNDAHESDDSCASVS